MSELLNETTMNAMLRMNTTEQPELKISARNSSRLFRLRIIAARVISVLALIALPGPALVAQSPLTITTSTPLPAGTVTTMYAQTLAAAGGTAPYAWAFAGGALPEGITISAAGVLSGTVMRAGEFNFVVEVTDANGTSATKVFTLTINNPVVQVEFIPPGPTSADSAMIRVFGTWPNGCVPQNPVVSRIGTDIRITTSNQSQVCTQALTNFSVLAAVGMLPTADYQVIVSQSFPGGLIELLRKSLSVTNPVPTITGLNPTAATTGVAGLPLTVNGTNFINGARVRWNGADRATTFVSSTEIRATITTGDLAVTGTARVTVFNPLPGGGTSGAQTFTINPPLAITTASVLPGGMFGTNYFTVLAATGGTLPVTWSVTGGALPNGLTLNPDGRLTGTPAVFGGFSFTAQVRDSFGLTAARVFTLDIQGGADLALTQNTSLNQNQSGLTYTITISNNGPNVAQSVTVTDTLPATVTFASCAATGGGMCAGSGNNRTVTFTSLAAGATAVITLTTRPVCATPGSQGFNNTATVSAVTPDQNPANNSATAAVTINCQAVPALTLAGGKTAFDFGTVAVNSASAAETFAVENTGNASFNASFNVRRTGSDVSGGKITNADDNVTFLIRLINADGTETPVVPGSSSGQILMSPGQRRNFRLLFAPNIPAPAGKTSGFTASQIVPETITSELVLTVNGSALTGVPLTGRVDARGRLINPLAPKLPPLIVMTRSGDEVTVEVSLHDPNNDIYLLTYQFLDDTGRQFGNVVNADLNLNATSLLNGQSFTTIQKFRGTETAVSRVRVTLYDSVWRDSALSAAVGTVIGRLTNVSAASFRDTALASEAIVAAFGTSLAATTQFSASLPLPVNLAGTRVFVRDSQQVERAAPLFFVSSQQVNFMIPEGTAPGMATLVITNGEVVTATETRMIEAVSPGLFTANSSGSGVAAAVALHVRSDNSLSYEPVAQFDGKQFIARPVDLGAASDQLFLILFGTGFRHHTGAVTARIGAVAAEVLYAGEQGGFIGLDQVNIRVPRSLAGSGEVDLVLSVDGKPANVVRVHLR